MINWKPRLHLRQVIRVYKSIIGFTRIYKDGFIINLWSYPGNYLCTNMNYMPHLSYYFTFNTSPWKRDNKYGGSFSRKLPWLHVHKTAFSLEANWIKQTLGSGESWTNSTSIPRASWLWKSRQTTPSCTNRCSSASSLTTWIFPGNLHDFENNPVPTFGSK